MQRDHIHITLAEDHIAGVIKTKQIAALIEDLCLRRVKVLRLGISHHTTAKSDDTVVRIHDREHDSVPELVIRTTLVHLK